MTHAARLFSIVLALASAPAAAQQLTPAVPVDVATLGPQVGQRLPAFSLPDQHGRPRTIESLMGRSGLMLVFSRSADWCPYCKTQMIEIQGRLTDLGHTGLNVAVITYDPVATLADFARQRGITYPLLSDAGSAVIRRFGILNTTIDPSNRLFGYPFPGTFIVNREGVVMSRYFEPTYQERNTVASLLVRLGNSVSVPATRVSSPNLEITSYLTDQTAAAGTHFSAVLDITPGPRIHVYAPGVTGYRPIALRIDPQPGLVVREAQYPSPETYHFAPLKEDVLVYQKPFRVVQDVMIDAGREGQAALQGRTSLTITGTLDYQACDDKVCFNPQTVPLSWTVDLVPLDRTRINRE
jgi:peroxiredoxin